MYQNYTLALRDRQITDLLTLKMINDDTQICSELKINELLMWLRECPENHGESTDHYTGHIFMNSHGGHFLWK